MLKKLFCRLFGHHWSSIGESIYNGSSGWRCRRCRRIEHGPSAIYTGRTW